MPRPKKDNKMIQYTIMLDPDIIEEIKCLSQKADLPAAKFTRNLVLTGLDEARLFDKAALLRLFGGGRKQIEKIKKQFNFESMNIFTE